MGLYVCGITPYDETHVGHARCYVVFDVLKRVLMSQGLKVTHIQNFTDVDDKIIKRAQEVGVPAESYPKPFIQSFHATMKRLNVLPADQYPLVTTHMREIIALIEKLFARGLAYQVEGDVYYAVRKFGEAYVTLSKRKLDDLESGARVEVDERKKDPLDFALWKRAKAGEPSWPSPWGQGRPGWHIECSAMSMKYLGEEFDIHGGGLDLIFPHHTNEIAQSVGASGKSFARVWMHNGFVTVDNEKMSKSLGNFFTLKDILAKFDPMAVRYFLLSQHYRSPLNFSDQALTVAATTWFQRILGAYRIAVEWSKKSPQEPTVGPYVKTFHEALANDLNTPDAFGEMNRFCSEIYERDKIQKADDVLVSGKAVLDEMFQTLGLLPPAEITWPDDILDLARARELARRNKEWKRSDEIRDQLKAKGVLVEDSPSGQRLKKAEHV
ncbi:MAG: Cysteine--tRNA ligase [Elusimicrobia bacterium]|nr:Cysteine--tRNA ligase [Elusimicrobiota bacterium]